MMYSQVKQSNKLAYKFKLSDSNIILLFVALITCTFFRFSLILLYPLIVLGILLHFRFKLMREAAILLGLVTLSTILSLLKGFYWQYNILSLFQIIPFVLLLFAVPANTILPEKNLLRRFVKAIAFVALINDIVGFIQYFVSPSDDSFMGIYSQYSISLYGLVILNTLLFGYYFSNFRHSNNKCELSKALFFLLCAIMGFYGAGLIAFIGAFVLSFFKFRLPVILRLLVMTVVSVTLVYFVLSWLRPEALHYYEVSIKRLALVDKSESPRKIISFVNYYQNYPTHTKDFLLGSGPGTFNSRAAFMAGSPYQFQALPFLKTERQPYYFENFAYPLWNHTNTSMALYQDGFRNQPFSSLLAFMAEYGILFTLAFAGTMYLYYRRVKKLAIKETSLAGLWLIKFLLLFLLMLLLIDNYAEYPEVMLLTVLLIKLTHVRLYEQSFSNMIEPLQEPGIGTNP